LTDAPVDDTYSPTRQREPRARRMAIGQVS
jgi:hypothetical protein